MDKSSRHELFYAAHTAVLLGPTTAVEEEGANIGERRLFSIVTIEPHWESAR
jgi:hypothetical protein